ncbi:MAG TPA: hypothetical protein VFF73_10415, partial [Planctomycetota bacterium]|nr:hypothetical protein [Planctomycetota bacterium]
MTYRLPDRFAGKRCRCRECGDSIRVPAAREDRAPAAKTAVKDPARTKKQRLKTIPSESLQQLAPLNLSESRHMDPPAARARIKKIKAEAKAPVSAKKRAAAGGPASESEIEVSRPEKK